MVDVPNPEDLLDHASIVGVAPWCRYLETFELALLLVTPLRGIGHPLTRGELVKRIEDVPEAFIGKRLLGELYYQRVSRAVQDLEDRQILLPRAGVGRRRGHVLTPFGFVTLMLNLRALRKDPLLEPSEFEMRREIIAATTFLLEALFTHRGRPAMPREVHAFFHEVDAVSIGGVRMMSSELVEDTVSIFRLVQRQRANVERRRAELEQAVQGMEAALQAVEVEPPRTMRHAAPDLLLAGAWNRARMKLPLLSLRAYRAGYARYLEYLEHLVSIYAGNLAEVSLSRHRRPKR